jgi:hypothetical protein
MTAETNQNSGVAGNRPGKRRIGLGEKVFVGLVLGLAVGVFFGEMTAFLKFAGDAFIMLLQMTVIPLLDAGGGRQGQTAAALVCDQICTALG